MVFLLLQSGSKTYRFLCDGCRFHHEQDLLVTRLTENLPMASTPSKDHKRREREQKKIDKRRAREEAKAEKLKAEQAAAEEAAKPPELDAEARMEAEFEAELAAEAEALRKAKMAR